VTSWEKYGQNDGNMPKPGKEKRELFGNLAALQQACCNFLSLSNLLEAKNSPQHQRQQKQQELLAISGEDQRSRINFWNVILAFATERTRAIF